jgi:lipopolysaccharide biosynthesis protein
LWWGPGFTEWRNVTSARPQFHGHYQPHLPADLGFYDLRVPEVREHQAALAVEAGLGGFVYYHYWFNGKRLLERPVDDMLASGRPAFPFCLAWANENWTRRWDGGENEILVAQHYSAQDDLEHIRALRPVLTDDRYLKRNGKPMLLVYRSSKLPDPAATMDRWRAEVRRWGLPGLYLVRVESFRTETGDARCLGFDSAIEFQPFWAHVPGPTINFRARRRLQRLSSRYSHNVFQYDKLVANAMSAATPDYPRWPGVTPGFDNSARRRREATILIGSNPQSYRLWLEQALGASDRLAHRLGDGAPGLVFINAWNEWAEGNHLEPDLRHGKAFIEATRAAIDNHMALRPGFDHPVEAHGA